MNTETRMREIGDELERAFTADLQAAAGTPARRRRRMAIPVLAGSVGVGLAAAGVAIALASGGGHGSSTVGGTHAPTGAPSGASAVDTADIVKRVEARVASATQGEFVISHTQYTTGTVSADGSLTLGSKLLTEGIYQASDGSAYMRQEWFDANGDERFTISDAYTPDGSGQTDDAQTVVDPSAQTYNQTTYHDVPGPDAGGSQISVTSTSAEVARALQTGRVRQSGTTTLDGRSVLVLSVSEPPISAGVPQSLTVYVDAQTYQPLQDVQTITLPGKQPDLSIDDWEAVTQGNIAAVEDASVPAGYREVTKAQAMGR